jgi:hypothetical protein
MTPRVAAAGRIRFVASACCLALAAGALRAEPHDVAAERQRIAAARAAAQQRYVERERECRTRFVVTSCVEDAQRERRATLAALRREENLLDEGQRQARAAERQEMLRERAQAEAARARDAQARPPRSAASGASLDRPSLQAKTRKGGTPPTPKDLLKSPGSLPGGPRSPEEEARSRAAFEAEQREAAEHRAEVEAKNARRAATKKPARPLPVPPAASAR